MYFRYHTLPLPIPRYLRAAMFLPHQFSLVSINFPFPLKLDVIAFVTSLDDRRHSPSENKFDE